MIFITGGHATPAVACIKELQKRGFNDLLYIGQKHSLLFDKNVSSEYRLITEKVQIPFIAITAGKFSLFPNFHSLVWLLRLPIGFLQAFWWQLTKRPELVLTFGSHVGVPVAFWAWVFHTPIVAHEQTTTKGRATKIIEKFATKVCYSWLSSADSEGKSAKFILTGNPIREEILKPIGNYFEFADQSRPVIFVTGGNQGAHSVNEFIFANLTKIIQKYNVIHQTGSNTLYNDFQRASSIAEKLNGKGIIYIPKDYLFAEEMADAYAQSSIVITRAGANSVTELLALRKKALLIPIPTTSGNEQFLNAKLLEELGLGKVVNQSDIKSIHLMDVLQELENQKNTDSKKIEEISNLHLNAQKKIVDEVEELIPSL